jgi:hypothetical protein
MELKKEFTTGNLVEVITPEEFIQRLGIARSTLYLWKSKGWLIERRHFLKIGKTVLYYWSNELLLDLHDNSNRTSSLDKAKIKSKVSQIKRSKDRVNWDY